jgi:hypothetical protein
MEYARTEGTSITDETKRDGSQNPGTINHRRSDGTGYRRQKAPDDSTQERTMQDAYGDFGRPCDYILPSLVTPR